MPSFDKFLKDPKLYFARDSHLVKKLVKSQIDKLFWPILSWKLGDSRKRKKNSYIKKFKVGIKNSSNGNFVTVKLAIWQNSKREFLIDDLFCRCFAGSWAIRGNVKRTYRVSHGKVNKVIWLCWGFGFLLIFWILRVHEIGPFMPSSSVFIQLMYLL